MADIVDNRYKIIDQAMKKLGYEKSALLEVLHVAQETFGYLDKDALKFIAKRLKSPYSKVYGVATFYHRFTLKPQGKHTVVVCLGTACYIKGSKEILKALENRFAIKVSQTTSDNILSLLSARCVGSCSIAPVMVCDNKTYGKLTIENTLEQMEEILS
jgi:bidirectional [NiFe] hydrogenase diaphorase subunit